MIFSTPNTINHKCPTKLMHRKYFTDIFNKTALDLRITYICLNDKCA